MLLHHIYLCIIFIYTTTRRFNEKPFAFETFKKFIHEYGDTLVGEELFYSALPVDEVHAVKMFIEFL